VRAYALTELGDRVAVHVYLRREDAFVALDDALEDDDEWARLLFVAPIELNERDVSVN
jgi:hypothetical protein